MVQKDFYVVYVFNTLKLQFEISEFNIRNVNTWKVEIVLGRSIPSHFLSIGKKFKDEIQYNKLLNMSTLYFLR